MPIGSRLLLATALMACGDDTARPDAGPCATCDGSVPPDSGIVPGQVEILRDTYGVPHVFAPSLREAMYGWGWADAEDLENGLLVQVWGAQGTSSRRLGALCGAACVESDAVSVTFRIPEAVATQYGSLSARTRMALETYAAGADAWFRERGAASLYDPAEPIRAEDLVAAFVSARIRHAIDATQTDRDGSNQAALTGDRTPGSLTLLLKDPHNFWSGAEPYVHVSFEDYDLVGNGPFIGCGGSNFMAWGCTRAAPATAVAVRARLRARGADPGTPPCGGFTRLDYFDHAAPGDGFVPFEMRCIDIDTGDSGIDATTWIFESRFGTLTSLGPDTDGDMVPDEGFITHVFAATDVSIVDYLVDRMLVRSAAEFLDLFAVPTPREDAQYRAFASAAGEVGIVLGAAVPALDPALDWSAPVPSSDPRIDGWTPNAEWADLTGVAWHNVDGTPPELPSVLAPAGDFAQNCNGGPAFATEPTGQVGPVAAFLELRREIATVRDVRMRELVAGQTIDLERMKAIATDITVPAGRDFVEAIRCGLDALSLDPVATYGEGGTLMAELLEWGTTAEYRAEPDSIGMTVMFLVDVSGVAPAYPPGGACYTRAELDVAGALLRDGIAPYMRRTYTDLADPLRVPWGHVNRALVAGEEHGMAGASGALASLWVSFFELDAASGRAVPTAHGGTRVPQILAYEDGRFESWITVPHGQVTEIRAPGSPHLDQTIDDFVARRFRRVPIDRAEVLAELCPWGDDPTHEHRAITVLSLP